MDIQSIIIDLEKEWDLDIGFLGGVRMGNFKPASLERLINVLQNAESLNRTDKLERRFVELTWYIPIFLMWQKEKLKEEGIDTSMIDSATTRIESLLENILGTP